MPLPRALPLPLPRALTLQEVPWVTTATITNNGLRLLAQALINSSANAAITYVAIGTGTTTTTGDLASGVPVTALPVAALANAVAGGQSLTLVHDTDSAVVTVTAAGAAPGATSIPIQSFTPAVDFPVGSGVLNTPAAGDIQLQAEAARVTTAAGVVGAAAGETLVSGYFDPSTPGGTYIEVGYFGGADATSAANSGTLVARDLMWWAHTLNVDSYTNQLDSTV